MSKTNKKKKMYQYPEKRKNEQTQRNKSVGTLSFLVEEPSSQTTYNPRKRKAFGYFCTTCTPRLLTCLLLSCSREEAAKKSGGCFPFKQSVRSLYKRGIPTGGLRDVTYTTQLSLFFFGDTTTNTFERLPGGRTVVNLIATKSSIS